ncbi:MAG: T9SS C-terminal target domain-containing protein [Bacteroidetes bacterium]|nr:MAG: T9SS C-terminal target domain-containing protein [Bacteroidota bacterium]
MKKSVLIIISVTILFLPLIVYTQKSWDYETCNNWHYKIYDNWMIRNNIWGENFPGAGEQCIHANSESNWAISATHQDGTGMVKGYPQAVRGWVQGGIGNTYPDGSPSPFVTSDHGLNQRINSLIKFDIYQDITLPESGRYMVLYDMYMHYTDMPQLPWPENLPDQLVMLFTAIHDDTGWMYSDAEQYPVETIGERQWRVRVSPSSIVNEFAYVLYPYPEWIIEEAHIDYLEILHYLKENHGLPGELRISTIQMGVEVIDGGYYEINDFNVDISANEDETSTMNMSYLQDVSLFPNPVRNGVINISLDQTRVAYANIYDLSGRLFISVPLQSESNYLNVESLSNGIYIVKIKSTDNITMKKLIIK